MSKIEDLKKYEKQRIERLLYAGSFYDFLVGVWDVIEPGVQFSPNWHIEAICEHMEAVRNGQIKRLNINIPPRHCKSIIASITFPCYVWTSQPDKRFITASYSLQLSQSMSRKRRMIIESEWYSGLWGDIVHLASDQNAKGAYENTAGGGMLATSTGGTITGFGADFLIADDLLNMISANGAARDAANIWFNEAFGTRLNNPSGGAIINIMQRLHANDVSGMLLERGGWENLVLPAEYEGSKYYTSIGWCDPRKDEGEPLWKDRIGTDVLNGYKDTLGAMGFAGQFQQRPVPQSGGLVKSQWIRRASAFIDGGYTGYRLGNSGKFWFEDRLIKFITVDLAISKNESSDYTCISVWCLSPDSDLILIDVLREKLDNPEQVRAIMDMHAKHSPMFIAIEAVAYQMAIVQQLLQKGLPVRAYKPGITKKEVRFMSASVYYENGKIYHVDTVPNVSELEQELLFFPLGKHDDFCDTAAMACFYIPSMLVPSIGNFEDAPISSRKLLDPSYLDANNIMSMDEEEDDF